MIIVMGKNASQESVEGVIGFIRNKGLKEHVSRGEERTIIGAVGDERVFRPNELERLPDVERVVRITKIGRASCRERV